MNRRRCLSIAATALLTAAAHALRAQTAGGQLLDLTTRRPLARIQVVLTDVKGRRADSTVTDSSGSFYLTAPRTGDYVLRFAQRDLWFDYSPRFTVGGDDFHQQMYLIRDHASDRVPTSDDLDEQPFPVSNNAAPRYPRSLRDKNIQGAALVRFTIDTDGAVAPRSAAVVSQSAPEFGQAILDVIYLWRFKPGAKQGRPSPVTVCMPSTFRLSGPSNMPYPDARLDSLIASWPAHDRCPP